MEKKTLILTDKQIQHKIKRIAFQILEIYDGEKDLIIAGISKKGFVFAQKLAANIASVSAVTPKLCEVVINKKNPSETPRLSLGVDELKNQTIILADDVLNTGSTLIYATKHLLETPLKELKTAVLVDRSHKKYPIKADFKGISLSTSIHETVKVEFGETSKAELF